MHEQVADDIRAGWDNHLEFARENPNFYKLMWSPAVAAHAHTPCAAAPTATDIEKGERAMTTTVAPELTTW